LLQVTTTRVQRTEHQVPVKDLTGH
jgi:hypothetical protein